MSWRTVARIRERWKKPLVLKGILHLDDVRRSLDAGVDAIVLSSHGGRQLDGAVATADALREVADAAGDALEVFVDGGVRRGTDVLRALALGARAVLVGRPVLWGLACDGAAGVSPNEIAAHSEAATRGLSTGFRLGSTSARRCS